MRVLTPLALIAGGELCGPRTDHEKFAYKNEKFT